MPLSRWTRLLRCPSAHAAARRRTVCPCLEALEDRVVPANVTILKTGPATVQAGATLTYTVSVTFPTLPTATNVSITDPLPSGLTLNTATQVSGPDALTNVSFGNTAEFGGVAVAPGHTDVFQITATASPTLTNGTLLTNTASFVDTFGTGTSSTVTTVVAPTLFKAGPATVAPGGQVIYTLNFSNTGGTGIEAILTDVLPAGLTLNSATQVSGADNFLAGSSGNTASFVGTNIIAGSFDVFQVVATASPTLSNGTVLADTATFVTSAGSGSSNTVTTLVASPVTSPFSVKRPPSIEFLAIEDNGMTLLGLYDTTNNRFVEASLGFFPNLSTPLFFTVPLSQNGQPTSASSSQLLAASAAFLPGVNTALSNTSSATATFGENGKASGTAKFSLNSSVPLTVAFTPSPGKEDINVQALNLLFTLMASASVTALSNNADLVSFSFFASNGTQTTTQASSGMFVQVV
jgi:uncharacterized repeat protein (TIGR01451 family)